MLLSIMLTQNMIIPLEWTYQEFIKYVHMQIEVQR